MDNHKVIVSENIHEDAKNYILKYCNCKFLDFNNISTDELYKEVEDVEGILATALRVDEELLSHAPKLKVVSTASVGYNTFRLEAMKSRHVMGTNTPSVLDDTVADLVFGLILSAARRIPELDLYVKQGKWKKEDNENLFGVDVHDATLGIIGMGRIGEAIAKRARLGFNMEVLYNNRSPKPKVEKDLGVKYSTLDDLLKKSDFVVLMTPLTKETRRMMGYREFDLMKRTAIFVNASRGKTVNEEALIDALKNKKILGAALDVYNVEPVNSDNPLLKMPNVVTVPHIGSSTAKTRRAMEMLAAKNLVAAVLGEVPPNLVPELR